MKKLIVTLILLGLIAYIFLNFESLVKFAMVNIVYRDEVLLKQDNIYNRNFDWLYVDETDNFFPENKQDILNIFYTALNGGWDELTFYCSEKYTNCLNDVEEMTNDNYLLSNINNYVSSYNSYSKIYININSLGRVNIQIVKIYSEEMITTLNAKVDEIYNSVIKDTMTTNQKILAIHDYIINHTVYDQARANEVKNGTALSTFHVSNTAYGALINGLAICGGYTDAMSLFLDKMDLENYKIASETHIWNYVLIDGAWKHLDLTWDDPVTSTGENRLEHNFFLITTTDLEIKETTQHIYDKAIYLEAQ